MISWGSTNDGRTLVPSSLGFVQAVAGGEAHSVALRADGRVVAWGFNLSGQTNVPFGLSGVAGISAGANHSVAVRTNGTVVVWGAHEQPPAGLNGVISVAAGWFHTAALRADGTVTCWGSQFAVPPGLSDVRAIAAGEDFTVALRGDGTVAVWGDNMAAQSLPANATNLTTIAAGQNHCLAVTRAGRVIAWGDNTYGQRSVPGGLRNVIAVAAGARHSLALRVDGTLVAWGDNSFDQTNVNPVPAGCYSVAAGAYHNLVIRGDGAPVILVQPASQTVVTTREASFQVIAAGSAPLRYQWQWFGTNLAGATASTLAIANVQPNNAGPYTVVVSNTLGQVASLPAVLTAVESAPFFVVAPSNTSVICGEPVTLQADANGTQPVAYHWMFAEVPIDGATSNRYTIPVADLGHAGQYAIVATNAFGAITSAPATLELLIEPPSVTSPSTVAAKQGVPFNYQVRALHSPTGFAAVRLPPGLAMNETNGLISGVPEQAGTFAPEISAINACASDTVEIVVSVAPSVPAITSTLVANGVETEPLTYQITATESPTSFAATRLPAGLILDPGTGTISGAPVYAGEFDTLISASNPWGAGSATLHFSITNTVITNLAIANVTYNYSKPYLLDFEFSLISPPDTNNPSVGNAVVVEPRLLSVECLEDDKPISASETGLFIERGSTKLLKAYLVLDFSASVASLAYGDTNGNGISDAVETMVRSAQAFVSQQAFDSQVGVYEFHRDDTDPQQVIALSSDKEAVNAAIGGIWTNIVQGYAAGSRCWDALSAAVEALGPTNRDEQHYVIFVSDGVDESSVATVDDVIAAATNNNVKIFCVGFGAELDTTTLQAITSATSGRYSTATDTAELATEFAQIAKDVAGQYILRWATLKRSSTAFMPSFRVSYQGWTALSPTNPVTPAETNIDETVDPPETNITEAVTNYIIGWYVPTDYAGSPAQGSLRLAADAEIRPTGINLRATYAPRYIRTMRIHYRANWPCTVALQSTNLGGLLEGWTMVETNDGAGGAWLTLSSPEPQTSIRFAGFGNLLTFSFRDEFTPTNAFSFLDIDSSIYTNTGQQSFVLENATNFVASYPVLTNGTPVPWLILHGIKTNYAVAELADQDADGVPTWKEYLCNTDPLNANSKLRITRFAKDQYGRDTVTFDCAANRRYRVESSYDLATWETVAEDITGPGPVTIVDPRFMPGTAQIYYRVAVY